MNELFRKFSYHASNAMGSSWAFVAAALVIVMWAASGPLFGFSDTWQLIINTGTTILTFLAVFLIQNTQNRDAKAIHLKLDELIRGVEGARTGMVSLEALPDDTIREIADEFKQIQEEESIAAIHAETAMEHAESAAEDAAEAAELARTATERAGASAGR